MYSTPDFGRMESGAPPPIADEQTGTSGRQGSIGCDVRSFVVVVRGMTNFCQCT